MKVYGVMLTEKNRIMKVMAEDEKEAQAEAERQLSRPGRYGILRQWKENGKAVKEIRKRFDSLADAFPGLACW